MVFHNYREFMDDGCETLKTKLQNNSPSRQQYSLSSFTDQVSILVTQWYVTNKYLTVKNKSPFNRVIFSIFLNKEIQMLYPKEEEETQKQEMIILVVSRASEIQNFTFTLNLTILTINQYTLKVHPFEPSPANHDFGIYSFKLFS